MGLLDLMAHGGGVAPGPADDYWYAAAPGQQTLAGVRVNADQAKKISAWYRGRDLLATSLAMLPLQLFTRLPDDAGADVARRMPLYDVLHTKPNESQNSFEWRRQKMYHLIDDGNAYSFIVEGPRGFADQLVPIADPKLVEVERTNTGRRRYHVKDATTGRTQTYTQDDIFHLMGASEDGVKGVGVLQYARNSLGTALATEAYAATVFSRGTLNSGALEVPGKLDAEASKRMALSFVTSQNNWHLPKVLEQGAKWVQSELTPEDAQMLLSRKFSIDDIARWLGVPPHMIGSLERSTNNNIEHQGQEFVTYSLGPWLSLWEFAINDQLVLATDRYYAEFNRDALVRGDLASRWQAYQIQITTGSATRNEVRRKENMKKLPGLDEPLNPAHLTGKPSAAEDETGGAPRRGRRLPVEDDEEDAERARAIVTESAARLVRKEVKAVQRLAVRYAADEERFASEVAEFYAAHTALLREALLMPAERAEEYCASQAAQVFDRGVAAVGAWEDAAWAAGLAAWALEPGRAA